MPEEDRILVRLTGALAESTGIAAGMSGSPVYIGDRLVGALTSTFPFVIDPVGMVTPIGAVLRPESARGSADVGTPLPMTGTSLGFDSPALSALSAGLPASIAFTAGGRGESTGNLEPGTVGAAVLVDGDWVLSILGTITWRSGDRVALFGHQVFGFGSVDLPLAGGSVVATLPNRALSFKMSNAGPVVGSITYDGVSGAIGQVGRVPRMLPVRITASDPKRAFDLRLAVHPLLTPLLLRTCVLNCGGALGGAGTSTASATMTIRFDDGSSRAIERAASGAGAFGRVSEDFGGVLDAVMSCPIGRIVPDSVVIAMAVEPEQPTYYLERVVIDHGPGTRARDVEVEMRFLSRDGVPVRRNVRLRLPEVSDTDALRLEVGDASSASQWEHERAALAHLPATAEDYLDEVFAPWRPNGIYLRIVTAAKGWSRRDGEVSRLPRSMAMVLGRAPQRGWHDLTSFSVVSQAEIIMDGPVYGSAIVDLTLPKEGASQ
jgi:hypothetical protein